MSNATELITSCCQCNKLLCEPFNLPFCKDLKKNPHYFCITCIHKMFKVFPIRGNCPVCKGEFPGASEASDTPAKKKSDDDALAIEPHVKKLYDMVFTKRMINKQLVDQIK